MRRLRKRLKRARERLWDRVRRRHDAPPGSPQRAFLAKQVRKARRYKDKLARRLKRAQQAAQALPGPPSWGGCRAITNKAIRIVDGRAPVTSRKRWATFGNPTSDHHMSQLLADAVDLGTFSGDSLAHVIAQRLGIKNYSTGNFNAYFITFRGRRFRIQILWAVAGHFNHIHVGARRA